MLILAVVIKLAYLIALTPYGFIVSIAMVISFAWLPCWILLTTRYEIINKILWIYSGPFKWQIPVLSISKIEPSRSWISSPALSLHRFRIEYGSGEFILVSPKQTNEFLHAIRDSMIEKSG